jgi:hypothetical protein
MEPGELSRRMNSLEYRMRLAAERTARIGAAVAADQDGAAARLPDRGPGSRLRIRRRGFWGKQRRRFEVGT